MAMIDNAQILAFFLFWGSKIYSARSLASLKQQAWNKLLAPY